MATVSMLIPVYNEIRFIDKTLQSVIGEADEIIVCDNASTDGTSEVCASYAARYPEIKYTRHARNLGAGANFNECVSRATGRYIRQHSGHDLLSRFSTQSMLKLMQATPDAGLVYPGFVARLNYDYTIDRFYPTCSFASEVKSPSPFERTLSVIEKLGDCSMYYGLYDAQLFRELFSEFRVFSFLTDHGMIAAMASKRKLLADDTSVFFRMDPRDAEPNAHERLERIATAVSGGKSDNAYMWLFAVLCTQYGLVKQMQSWEGAPPDFMQNAVATLLRIYGFVGGVRVNRDGFPAVLPGREALADEVFELALEHEASLQEAERRKTKNRFRLAAHSILTKLPETNLTGALRKRLEEKLRRKRLLK